MMHVNAIYFHQEFFGKKYTYIFFAHKILGNITGKHYMKEQVMFDCINNLTPSQLNSKLGIIYLHLIVITALLRKHVLSLIPIFCRTTMQQHLIDISINITMITESESTTEKKNIPKH